jgi:hypothetical protein
MSMHFAYADPPYLGCGKLYQQDHPDALVWDDPATHRVLINRLVDQYPDGWALSASSPSLRTILPMCPDDVRVMAWVKPFAVFKPNVGVAYAWEPVIVRGGRRRSREQSTVRDWFSHDITLRKGLTGAKPPAFVHWVMDVLNVQKDDGLADLFPGTGIVERCANVRVTGATSLADTPLGWNAA